MDFNSECKVLINSMNRAEARVYILFLESEMKRHQKDIEEIVNLIHIVVNKFKLEGITDE